MKKNFDLESAEKWAEKCFSGIEKNIVCERMPDIKECTVKNNKMRYTDERSPLLQVAGVFAAAVLVVGLTFGALKYLEHVANQHGPAGADTSASDTGKEPTDTSSLNGTDTEPSTKPASVTGDTDTEPPETFEYEDGVTSVPLFKKLPGFVEDEEYCVYVLSDNGGIVGFQIERKGYDTSKITKETVNKHNSEKLFEYTGILYLAEYTQCIKEIPDFVLLGVYNMDSTAYTNPMLIGSKGPGGRIVVYYMYILEEFAGIKSFYTIEEGRELMEGLDFYDIFGIDRDNPPTGRLTVPSKIVLTCNDVNALMNLNDKIALYAGADNLTGFIYDGAEKWNGMILLTKDGKQFLYKTEFYGTADNRQRYGFLFPDLPDGFDSIQQISEGVYLIWDNGKRFPATLHQNKLYKDVDCTAVLAVAEDRVAIKSAEMKTGLYYVGYGVFEELYPQTADDIVYCAEPTYTEDGDRFDLFFAKENGCYAVFVTETDSYGSAYVTRASDFVYTNVKADENNVMTAERGGKTYYISPYDGSESDTPPKDHRVIQTIGGYQVIRYYRNLGCGVADSDGNTVIPFEYWMIYAVSEDRFFCSKIKGEDGVILDNNGNLIADGFRFVYPITPDFEYGNHFENLYLAERNGDAVWIDKDGNVLGFE